VRDRVWAAVPRAWRDVDRSWVVKADSGDHMIAWRQVAVDAVGVLEAELNEVLFGLGLECHVAGVADQFKRHRGHLLGLDARNRIR
jgi:hypothetical protein